MSRYKKLSELLSNYADLIVVASAQLKYLFNCNNANEYRGKVQRIRNGPKRRDGDVSSVSSAAVLEKFVLMEWSAAEQKKKNGVI